MCESLSHVWFFATLWTVAHQAPLSMNSPGNNIRVVAISFSRRSSQPRDQTLRSVQSLSCVWLFATPWTAAHQASLSLTNSQSLSKLMSIESVMPSNHLLLCHPLLIPPSIFPSIRVFSNELTLRIRWPKYWSFSFNVSPSNEHSGLISFRMDWLDLLEIQGMLKSLLQHHGSKATILQHSVSLYSNSHIHTWPLEKP